MKPIPKQEVIGLDLMRLVAAAYVVAYHFLFFSWAGPHDPGSMWEVVGTDLPYPGAVSAASWGWVGVEVFFFISGFVITMSAESKGPLAFARGRFLRLYPALLVFSLLSTAVVSATGGIGLKAALVRWLHTITLAPVGPWIDGVVWTLVVEVNFYLLVFLWLWSGRRRDLAWWSRLALGGLGVFFAAVLAGQLWGGAGVRGASAYLAGSFFSRITLLTTGPFFLLGMFVYEVHRRGLDANRLVCASLAAVLSAGAVYVRARSSIGVAEFGQDPLVPVAVWAASVSICCLGLALERRRAIPASLRSASRTIGLLTYPLYLVHEIPGGWLLGRLQDTGMGRWPAFLLCFGAVLAVSAWLSNRVERRVRAALERAMLAIYRYSSTRAGQVS